MYNNCFGQKKEQGYNCQCTKETNIPQQLHFYKNLRSPRVACLNNAGECFTRKQSAECLT